MAVVKALVIALLCLATQHTLAQDTTASAGGKSLQGPCPFDNIAPVVRVRH